MIYQEPRIGIFPESVHCRILSYCGLDAGYARTCRKLYVLHERAVAQSGQILIRTVNHSLWERFHLPQVSSSDEKQGALVQKKVFSFVKKNWCI